MRNRASRNRPRSSHPTRRRRRSQSLRAIRSFETLEPRHLLTGILQPLGDLNPGFASSFPGSYTQLGDRTFFLANRTELWSTDGTAEGTQLVRAAADSHESIYWSDLVVHSGTLAFFESQQGFSLEGPLPSRLWKSDGTTEGTVVVKDFGANSELNFSEGAYLTSVGDTLFGVFGDDRGSELWKTDLTEEGTVLVRDIRQGEEGSSPGRLVPLNGEVLFYANDGETGWELWKSDGTEEGTVLVKDLVPGPDGGNPYSLTTINGKLFFTAEGVGDDGIRFTGDDTGQWWVSDGSTDGTTLLKEFDQAVFMQRFAAAKGMVLGVAGTSELGSELWRTDGTPEGTQLVKDLSPGDGSSDPDELTAIGGQVFFSANDGTRGRELWKTDGTAAGTVLVKDIAAEGGSNIYSLASVRGALYFAANDGAGEQLWRSDGTERGTLKLTAIGGAGHDAFVQDIAGGGSFLFFAADEGPTGSEPWSLTIPQPWQNYGQSQDVDGDGLVVPQDVLLVINEINNRRFSESPGGKLPDERPLGAAGAFNFDVNGDGFATSADALHVINLLNLRPGFIVAATDGLTTSETDDEASAEFTVRLTSPPLSPVTVGVSSSAPSEGEPDVEQLVFDASNWDVPQTVRITGVDDNLFDGDQAYQIVLAAAVSSDAQYEGRDPADVTVSNQDDEVASIEGNYRGGFQGLATVPGMGTFPVDGDVAFSVAGLQITVTEPTGGTGTIDVDGSIAFGIVSHPEYGTCNFDGSFTRAAVVTAAGQWTCHSIQGTSGTASGQWNAMRLAADGEGERVGSTLVIVDIARSSAQLAGNSDERRTPPDPAGTVVQAFPVMPNRPTSSDVRLNPHLERDDLFASLAEMDGPLELWQELQQGL